MEIPAGTAHARFSLFDDYTDGADDLDLYVFGPVPADPEEAVPFVGGSGTPTSEEEVTISPLEPGTYLVVVHRWQTDGPDSNYTLFSWSVDVDRGADDGTLNVADPGDAVLSTTDTIDFSWNSLAEGNKYLGAVSHSDPGGIFGWTLVSIATD